MNFLNIFFLTLVLFLSHKTIATQINNIKSCQNLIKSLDLNTTAYNKCLFSEGSEKFTAEELKACQSHYLSEIERLSYVYKNICR